MANEQSFILRLYCEGKEIARGFVPVEPRVGDHIRLAGLLIATGYVPPTKTDQMLYKVMGRQVPTYPTREAAQFGHFAVIVEPVDTDPVGEELVRQVQAKKNKPAPAPAKALPQTTPPPRNLPEPITPAQTPRQAAAQRR